MKPTDLSGLIKGLMVVIGIAMALGRLDDLKRWAAREAFGVHTACTSHYLQSANALEVMIPATTWKVFLTYISRVV